MKNESSTLEALDARLARVDAELCETLRRLPAHSVKPVLMALLLNLEDERDSLLERIKALRESAP